MDETGENGEAEGEKKYFYATRYERDPKNRLNAIKIHGLSCKVCGFNFYEKYGEIGLGFIEIHHIVPLSAKGKAVIINPRTDLVPVCSNCHRMIHRSHKKVTSIEDLKRIVEEWKTTCENM